ncbi:conjugal transfer protein TraB [Novosphingobium sp. G106]|uniref:TraB/VirB10 family protein n=1 Tax=Novosphingobium sp. G106 TaxID=2849500 RepID=UPI001C2CDC53|nr:TraB/VirB10 family protein [Novosphingobium sp. G106]MBV1692707.1 conjugal transfer protein TraB [Novosphingobium sp. G106]
MAGLSQIFRRKRSVDAGEGSTATPSLDLGDNDEVLRKQRLALYAGGSVLLAGAVWWIFSESPKPDKLDGAAPTSQEIKVSTDDLGSRNLSEKEWIAMSENRLQSQDNQIRRMSGQGDQIQQLQSQIDALRAENQSMASDGSRVLSAYEDENRTLKNQLAAAQSAPATAAGPRALYGAGGPAAYQGAGGIAGKPVGPRSDLKVINFTTGSGAAGPGAGGGPKPADRGNTVFTDSPNYLPANSFATARVIVGVDASSNVQSQADPLPVVLRITGPARSAAEGGRVLTTRLQGCLVNGAARGDLSSEKVYVRLAKMTCPQPGGRYAESEVKGFIAFGGKTGVRGRVVSREGSLATQAFMAGLVGGIGRGFSANANSYFTAPTTVVNGQREKISTSDIMKGGLGEGVSAAGDKVSQYLIERAEQYQPVIEMPTGIDVEIVFLEGAFIRN